MLVKPLLLGILTLSHATDPSCSAEDEESLLQTKQARVQAHPLQAQTEINPSLLLESVQGMAKQFAKVAQVPESMTAAITSVNAALATMEPGLEEEHDIDQQQIQSQVDEIQACHSSEAHGTLVTNALAGELAVMTQCMADQAAAEATRDRECSEWTTHAMRLVFPPSNLQIESPEVAYEISLSLKDWVDEHWALIESQRSECNDASAFAASEASRCSPVIADYGDKFCQHSQACSLQSACHVHEVEVYNTLTDEKRVAMSARLARYGTIQHVRCVMGLIDNALNTNATIDDSDLGSCNGDEVTGDVDHLTLDFPSSPAEPQCPAPQMDDPQCAEIDLPLAWSGGEAAAPHQDVLFEVPGVVPVPQVVSAIGLPQYTSFTVDYFLTQFSHLSREGPLAMHYLCCFQGWRMYQEPRDNNIRVEIGNGVSLSRFDMKTDIPYGTEFRVTVTYDATTRTMTGYINGRVGVTSGSFVGEDSPATLSMDWDFHCAHCGFNLPASRFDGGSPTALWGRIPWQVSQTGQTEPYDEHHFPLSIGVYTYDASARYPLSSEHVQIRDFKFIDGAHPPQ